MSRPHTGFTLIELMIVVAVIAIIASLALPNLLASRMAANESAAISTLRQLASCQAQVKAAAYIDGDGDGVGEFGYFGELAGSHSVRGFVGGVQAIVPAKVKPPVASSAFGNVQNGRVSRSGYLFQVFLPDAGGNGIPELATGGADPASFPDPDLCEIVWCAYAWPVNFGSSSNRTFFTNQQGDLLHTLNDVQKYSATNPPSASAAFISGGSANNINQPTANTHPHKLGMDGQVWTNVN